MPRLEEEDPTRRAAFTESRRNRVGKGPSTGISDRYAPRKLTVIASS